MVDKRTKKERRPVGRRIVCGVDVQHGRFHLPFFNSSASCSLAVSFLSPPPPAAGGLAALPVSFSSRSTSALSVVQPHLSACLLPTQDAMILPKRRGVMSREFNVVIEQDEDGYFVASVPVLRGCHTQAKSLDVLMKRIKEAISLCLEVEDAPVSNRFIGVQRVAVMV